MTTDEEIEAITSFSVEFNHVFKPFSRNERYGICLIGLVPEYVDVLRRYNGEINPKALLDLLFPVFMKVAEERGECGAHLRVIQVLSKITLGNRNAWKTAFDLPKEWRSQVSRATNRSVEIARSENKMYAFYGEYHTPSQWRKRNQIRAMEIVDDARTSGKWTPDAIVEFCRLAGIKEFDVSSKETVKAAVNRAAEILNIRLS